MKKSLTIGALSAATALLLPACLLAQQVTTVTGPGNTTAVPQTALGVTDVFVGRNVVGPYVLSWKEIDAGSEVIVRDSRRLVRDQDYKIDPKAGVLTFTTPLRTKQIARVDYRYVPGKSAANTALSAPLQFNLFERGNGALSFNAIVRPEAPGAVKDGKTPSQGLMLLGFNGNAQLASQSTLTSKLFVDAQGGNFLERSGLQLSEKSKTSFGQFSAGFTRVGAGFKAGQETGLVAGKKVIEAAGSLNAIHGIAASASFAQTTDLPADGKGSTVTVLGQRLAGTLGAARFTATRTETTTDAPDGLSTTRTANRLQVDQKLGAALSATAVFEHNETATQDGASVAQTSTLNLRSQPTEAITLSGTFQNRLLPNGPEDVTNLKVEATPTKTVKLAAVLGDQYSKTAAKRSREASLEFAPNGRITLSGMVQVRGDGTNEATAQGFTASARPNRFLEVAGGLKMRQATANGIPDPTVPDTYNVQLSFGLPNKSLRLTGGYADNPEDDKGVLQRARNRSVGLQSTLGQFDLTGNYTFQEDALTAKVNTVLDAKFGWRLSRATQIVTAFREAQAQDAGLLTTDTYSVSLTHRIGSIFDLALSGVMTTYQKDGLLLPDQDYRAEAKLGIRF